MCPRRSAIVGLALAWLVAPVCAQATAEPDAVERYLAARGLDVLLETHLRERLEAASVSDRPAIAERLADIYVSLLNATTDVDELASLERRCRELLRVVPDAETSELRINLARARYLGAQNTAERHRLLLAEADEVAQAQEVLRATSGELERLASTLHRRVETLVRELRKPNADESYIREALEESRRLRSLAFYYAGWSDYYLGLLSGRSAAASDATRRLGWILGADGRVPAPDQVQPAMLRFEHVARSAIGCALAESLRGEDVRAARWLETLSAAGELHPAAADQMLMAHAVVYTGSRRWADLLSLVERERARRDAPFEPSEARLIAVLTLARLGERSLPGRDEIIEAIAQVALGDLVQTGQIGHVLDLVEQFGTLPLGDRGFIVRYARAIQAYQRARDLHAGESAAAPNDPTEDATIANAYRLAADALEAAIVASDAADFPPQRDQAATLRGLALFLAGDAAFAADVLEAAAADADDAQRAEEALWYAIVALDYAIERGSPSLAARRVRAAELYLSKHATSPRAARLILTTRGDPVLAPEAAVEILLAVPADDPLYPAAQRQATRFLYAMFRRAKGAARDAAALRFATRADAALALTRQELASADGPRARELSAAATLLVRQMLDATLGLDPPDLDRARAALAAFDEFAAVAPDDASGADIEAELAYRRLQIAVATGDDSGAERALALLRRDPGSAFARSVEQLLFRDAVDRFDASQGKAMLASRVVRFGLAMLDRLDAAGEGIGSGPASATARAVAQAVGRAAVASDAVADREAGLEVDRRLRDAGAATPATLRRIAEASAIDRPGEALDAWRRLLAGLRPPSDEWFEARYESLRLLAQVDLAAARAALDQHVVFYPEYGPEPWGRMLAELDAKLPAGSPGADRGGGGGAP